MGHCVPVTLWSYRMAQFGSGQEAKHHYNGQSERRGREQAVLEATRVSSLVIAVVVEDVNTCTMKQISSRFHEKLRAE